MDVKEVGELFRDKPWKRMTLQIFVDEAQYLSKVSQNKFLSEQTDEWIRSMYSAVILGFNCDVESSALAISNGLLYTVMTAQSCLRTVLSQDSFKPAVGSSVVKQPRNAILSDFRITFEALPVLGEEDAKVYMTRFADLSLGRDKHVRHECKWLCEQPIWTATFLSCWLQGSQSKLASGEVKCPELLKEMRNCIAIVTQKPPRDMSKPLSLVNGSTYATLKIFWVGLNKHDVES